MNRQKIKQFFYSLISRVSKYDYNSINKIFESSNRKMIHRVFVYFLVVIVPIGLAISIARIILVKFPSSNKVVRSKAIEAVDLSVLKNYKLFKTVDSDVITPEKIVIENDCRSGEPVPSTLTDRITLVSILPLQDHRLSLAAIKLDTVTNPNYLREGGELEDLLVVYSIETDRVIYQNKLNNNCEYLENKDLIPRRNTSSSPIALRNNTDKKIDNSIKQEESTIIIDKKIRDDALKNMASILGQANAVPINNADGTKYFRMTEIVPGSIYTQLNVANGDIITAIDGEKITDISKLMTIFKNIGKLENIRLTINKNGNEREYTYKIQ